MDSLLGSFEERITIGTTASSWRCDQWPWRLWTLRKLQHLEEDLIDRCTPEISMVVDGNGKCVTTITLAGLTKELTKITLENGVLTIVGSVEERNTEPDGKWELHATTKAYFKRAVNVHPEIRQETVQARFKDGRLIVEYDLPRNGNNPGLIPIE
ncbi:BQ2448_5292 [Microbotryum intermedium]|uniref:BQ2448_5292 protein n=1 Tax=Microbotryum intermedium TaxID=269621 RepID=A0A238F6J9_9BASI|nr:BQ2448_5292 [Microbotryum intermedium]